MGAGYYIKKPTKTDPGKDVRLKTHVYFCSLLKSHYNKSKEAKFKANPHIQKEKRRATGKMFWKLEGRCTKW